MTARVLEKVSDDSVGNAFSATPLLRSKSAAERVVSHIIDSIRSGSVKAGDRLPSEAELARAYQVSRPVVREAMRGLAVLGVVETRQGGRCFVTDLSVARLMAPLQFVISLDETSAESLHQARLLIEVGLAEQAAARADGPTLARLEEMVEAGFELKDDPLGFRVVDHQFHRTIGELGGNPFLSVISQSLYELGMEYRRAATETTGVLERSAAEHKAILEALRDGDSAAAATAMSAHLTSIHASTVEAMRRGAAARHRPPRSA